MSFKFMLAAAFVAASVAPALADSCSEPIPPTSVDGATATKEQMTQARDDTVRYIKASDDYQACLFADMKAQKLEAVKAKKPFDSAIEDRVNAKVKDNQAEKEKIGAEYNAATVFYKGKHPGG